MGGIHLFVGLLLLLSHAVPPPPQASILITAMSWLAVVPPVLTFWFYRIGNLPRAAAPTHSTKRALALRLLAALSISVGFVAVYIIYFTVALLAGLGFWSLLTPIAQLLVLLPLQLLAVMLGVVQAHSHGFGFINSNNVETIPFDGADTVLVLAGYAMLLGPLLLLWTMPTVLAPPWINLILGGLAIAVGAMLLNENK